MKFAWGFLPFCFFTLIFALTGNRHLATAGSPGVGSAPEISYASGWYFAVSGDSRDCGDLIMPKIAKSIEDNRAKAPVQFYWHLGDLRRMFDIDCDFIKRKHPDYDCKNRPGGEISSDEMSAYLSTAWDD